MNPQETTYSAENTRLILDNMHHVYPLARQYATEHVGCEYDDLVQSGMLGLIRAAHAYRPLPGVPFWAYARSWVLGEIHRALSNRFETEPLTEEMESSIICDEQDMADYGVERADLRKDIEQIFSPLSRCEQDIVWKYYEEGYTQCELARMYGFSQPYISKILRKLNKKREGRSSRVSSDSPFRRLLHVGRTLRVHRPQS